MTDDVYREIMARLEAGECWQWRGALSVGGLPQYGKNKINIRRELYIRAHGALIRGKPLSVTCGNAKCVNPAHVHAPADYDSKAYQRAHYKRRRTFARWTVLVQRAIARRRAEATA